MPRLPHPRTALSGYADRRLPTWRRALVRRHLLRCTRCAMEVARVRALRDAMRAAPPPVPGPSDELLGRLLALGGVAHDRGQERGHVPVQDPGQDGGAPVPAGAAGPPGGPASTQRPSVGLAGVVVVAAVMLGTVGAGAAVTGVGMPWAASTARASVSVVLPRLWHGDAPPGGAVSVRPVDDGTRP